MNDDTISITSDITSTVGDLYTDLTAATITTMPTGSITISNGSSNGIHYGSIAMDMITEDLLDKWIMNRVTVDHKVQEQELLKLKEVAPDYANEIKENLTKNATRDIIKKMTFTKKHDKDADVHHFIGRVWCFTEEELKKFIEEIKNV